MLGLLCENQMSMGFQLKVLASIAIFRTEIDSESVMQTSAKEATGLYHQHVMALPKEERRGTAAPFLLVVDSMIVQGQALAILTYPEGHKVRLAFTAYENYITVTSESQTDRLQILLEDFRFARFRTTHTKSRTLMEIGISPTASSHAAPILKAITQLANDALNGVVKAGVAPKTGMEVRIEQAMKALGLGSRRR
jgi:hypothetical protein